MIHTCLSVCLQVSESGKALLDVLQRCPTTDADDSTTKPDFTAATHGIMGVLHQVMQVRPTVTCLTFVIREQKTDRVCFCRVTMRWRGRGSTVSCVSTSVYSCVSSSRM